MADYENERDNPYAAPESDSQRDIWDDGSEGLEYPPARRLARLAAQFGDGLVGVAIMIPGIAAFALTSDRQELMVVGVLVLSVNALVLMIIQLYLLSTTGQSLGKKLAKVRIVDNDDGQIRGFWRIVGLRMFVPGLIGAIPIFGPLFSLIDILMIFGEERRCLHDRIANTRVIDVSQS